ncbi:hypothetical protein NL676_014552 [Syzygium grande]|nr:hypothetical protein NL676_014552 [Syzygium grande]
MVNGKAWPYMVVRRRKYRFGIINASNARFFRFFFTNRLEIVHVAAYSAYLDEPLTANETLVAPFEIVDVVVGFSKSKSDHAVLANDGAYPYPSSDPVNEANSKVMKFIIKKDPEVDPTRILEKLIEYPSADPSAASRTRYIAMYEYTSDAEEPTHLHLNGKPLGDPATETPVEGSTEVWHVINLTEDSSPLHVHLGLFRVVDPTELLDLEEFKGCVMISNNNAERCRVGEHARGRMVGVRPHEKGWKNVYKMTPGYVTAILVRFFLHPLKCVVPIPRHGGAFTTAWLWRLVRL